MNSENAINCFSALGHPGRLALFQRLIMAGPEGMKAGEIAKAGKLADSTTSAQLATLAQAGLISAHREGRSIRYLINAGSVRDLMYFLIKDCCGGRPEFCQDLAISLLPSATGPCGESDCEPSDSAQECPVPVHRQLGTIDSR